MGTAHRDDVRVKSIMYLKLCMPGHVYITCSISGDNNNNNDEKNMYITTDIILDFVA